MVLLARFVTGFSFMREPVRLCCALLRKCFAYVWQERAAAITRQVIFVYVEGLVAGDDATS